MFQFQLIIFVLVYRTTASGIREAPHHFVVPNVSCQATETGNGVLISCNFEHGIVSIRSSKRTVRCRKRTCPVDTPIQPHRTGFGP
jgi:hypothetical protein